MAASDLPFERAEYQHRLERVQTRMAQDGLKALFI